MMIDCGILRGGMGTGGYEIGKTEVLEEAKEICVKHLEKIYNKIKAELGV